MTSKIYGDNDESCFNKISLNEKNNKGIGNTPMIKINFASHKFQNLLICVFTFHVIYFYVLHHKK